MCPHNLVECAGRSRRSILFVFLRGEVVSLHLLEKASYVLADPQSRELMGAHLSEEEERRDLIMRRLGDK